MTRLYGRSQASERCVDYTPHGHWHTNTFIAALRHDRIDAPMLFDGPMNSDVFLNYVEKVLAPTLEEGDLVICDNLSSHKSPAVKKALQLVGADIIYLPPYSPDMNPIEMHKPPTSHTIYDSLNAECSSAAFGDDLQCVDVLEGGVIFDSRWVHGEFRLLAVFAEIPMVEVENDGDTGAVEQSCSYRCKDQTHSDRDPLGGLIRLCGRDFYVGEGSKNTEAYNQE
jgi:hypothetical protein